MRRKLVKQGQNALTLTVPAKWTKLNSMVAGDEANVLIDGARVVITPVEIKHPPRVAHIDFSTEHLHLTKEKGKKAFTRKEFRFINRMLAASYKLGFDEVKVYSDDKQVLEFVRKNITDYVGHEIIDESETFVHAKSYADLREEKISALINRLFYFHEQYAGDVVDAIKKNDREKLVRLLEIKPSHSRLSDLCKRIVMKKVNEQPTEFKHLYVMVMDAPRILRQYQWMIRQLLQLDTLKKIPKPVLSFMTGVADYVVLCNSFIRTPSIEKLAKVSEQRNNLEEKGYSLMGKQKQESLFVVHFLLNIVIRYYGILESGLYYSGLIKEKEQIKAQV